MNQKRILASIFSFFIVAFGQPAWVGASGLLTAIGGYALFWWTDYRIMSIINVYKTKNICDKYN